MPDVVASTDPLPTTLGGVTVAVTDAANPVYPRALPNLGIRSLPQVCGASPSDCTAVTVQIPHEMTCNPDNNGCTISPRSTIKVQIQANGVAGASFWFAVSGYQAHLLHGCDYIPNVLSSVCDPVVTHADGSLVSQGKPARPGEVVAVYAVGLGKTPSAATGRVPEGIMQCPSRGPNVRLVLNVLPQTLPKEFVDICVAGQITGQTSSQGMWASVSVPEPNYVEGINTASITVRFSLLNDGTVPLSTYYEESHLLVNGVEPRDWSFAIVNGFGMANSLAPGQHTQLGIGIGDRYFAKPGIRSTVPCPCLMSPDRSVFVRSGFLCFQSFRVCQDPLGTICRLDVAGSRPARGSILFQVVNMTLRLAFFLACSIGLAQDFEVASVGWRLAGAEGRAGLAAVGA